MAEAITESYLPLIEICDAWLRDGIDARLSMSITPCLVEMLSDPYRQTGYMDYLTERIAFLDKWSDRLRSQPALFRVAKMYVNRFVRCKQVFEGLWKRDMVAVLGRLQRSGVLCLMPSAATHAYLPLWILYPEMIELQIRIGREIHKKRFGQTPAGFWLPECGFAPGIDALLFKTGVEYFFVDTHGITHGVPKPKYDVYAPVFTPSGVAAFGRDWRTHDIIWRDMGYPGDPNYLSLHGDILSELTENGGTPLGAGVGDRPLGIRCHRRWPNREPYDPESALARCAVHAENFVQRCRSQIAETCGWLPRPPVIVGSFDTEHFGHWWYEGPTWLDLVVRKCACEHKAIRLVTAEEYLELYPENQMISPAMSSWGYQGYNESWLMGRNHWIYPELFERVERLRSLASGCRPNPLIERALAEYIRELIQAQASDWAYIMHAYPEMHYAGERIRRHLETMDSIEQGVQTNSLNVEWLVQVEKRNALFRDLDVLGIYRAILRSG